ncbi:MAG: hypothetical protein H3C31_04960 [Brumimicrobium sp.]|nr:hypothetical protein [Brumimicrobium sp.]MCO5269845.1 hypothetical protein [Brumimicrobium sp.]
MTNSFNNMTIQYIQLEEKTRKAEVEVQYIQDKVLIETVLMLGLTDLNLLLARLNSYGISLDLSEDFDNYATTDGNLYTLDFTKRGWDNIEINDFEPRQDFKQIRA